MTRAERDERAMVVRSLIQSEMLLRRRGWSKRVDSLQWELDHLTSADAINDRRAQLGLPAFANALDG